MRLGGRRTIMPHGFWRHDPRMTVTVPCIGVAAIASIRFFDTTNRHDERQASILHVSAALYKQVIAAHAVVDSADG